MAADVEVVKGGETIVNCTVSRAVRGAAITIKISPTLEEMMKNLGTGEVVDVRTIGHRYWDNQTKGEKLMLYELTAASAQGVVADGAVPYRLDAPGHPIVITNDRGGYPEIVNLSFLRLVGISEGLTFIVKGVFQEKDIIRMGERIRAAIKAFYANFMRPVDYHIVVSAQAIRPGQIEAVTE